MIGEFGEILETRPGTLWLKFRATARRGRRLLAAIERRLEKRRSRRRLSELTDDELRDIGLTSAQAKAETSKSWFWV
ncbi:Uncharacterized conserved protein YjiS, DUF1127 family [Rhizobium aethiopicum]|uniref:Uncharacterized conserved protein YjiS, DUF1127 family n=1 Tax=Rhizobium aethiopicum TaxID=1138170 RepID=A0A1C3Y6C4_9HYPH|nr:DUF1127 domain-containing protein [Rhizobium aethiopicum]SCB60042.1 Uncharacterized conserved protein YjiS, DUF1127 family [Rhizobium aethiopicum]